MSFSSNVKAEICRAFPGKTCCARAECFGILLYCNTFTGDCIRIVTESRDLGAMLPRLFKKAFGFGFDELPEGDGGKQSFVITGTEKLQAILHTYGFSREDTVALHVNLGVLEEECCKTAFLRGAFLAGGSVTNPAKGYHLELTTSHSFVCRETYPLIQELLGVYPKRTVRGGSSVLYFKQSNSIEDFLTLLGAPVAAMEIMEAKVEKELNNKVNRRCNCDDANTSKVVDAAQEQLAAIRRLEDSGRLESLPQKLLQAARARQENPESSLTELAGLMEPPITKSSMSHRLRRLVELSEEG
ncbi:MAG: DNA-binding protein WhiA [Clostridiales bacterium]|nr:DNA-binding protein WhiA [Clostridiales bacterium]